MRYNIEGIKYFQLFFDHVTICGLVTEYLKQHMSNHGDERNFECDKCEKVCKGYKALVTMRFTNGEFVESSHYSRKKEKRTHGFKVKRAFGTPKHMEKSLKSLIWHNSKRAGFTPPSKLQLRTNSPHSNSNPSPFSSGY